ncbi:mandelate racemase/muconate lactonizing enzyme family protein [Paraburkholderia acidisoli]|uniref:Galactokinase n=1 Tax=Paraburkholderia acidisoli TaxID=2571748 RepID=A0A7Z2JJQ6_9BURK|nr:mandelate racemase/muconate lactonizing enzyme family protein [Paraburkholderia acidisoli]QGZ67026.1 galactokinase [Paraburkholderia acidisoli]
MKIVRITTLAAGPYLFTRVETDDGLVGLGEAGDWAHLDAVNAEIGRLAQYFVGKDPRQVEHHWQYTQRSTFFRSSVLLSAIASIDIALWDLKAKALGVPVYELFGGRTRDRVRSYAVATGDTPDEIAASCRHVKKLGFDAVRVILPSFKSDTLAARDHVFNRRVTLAVDKVLACRDAVGPDFDLCVEAHRAFSVTEAIAIGRGIEAARPLFFEDPIAPENIDAMATVVAAIGVPVATGERAVSLPEFQALLNAGVAVLRPDVCAVGGLTPARKAAVLAEAAGALIAPHNPLGPVSTAACLQLDLSSSAFLIQEFPSFNIEGREDSMVATALEVEAGYLIAPEAPGIGVTLAANIETRHPAAPRTLTPAIGYDGSVVAR